MCDIVKSRKRHRVMKVPQVKRCRHHFVGELDKDICMWCHKTRAEVEYEGDLLGSEAQTS